MNQRFLTVLIAQCLEECTGHIMQFDDRHTLSFCHSSHGIRIVAMRFLYFAAGSFVKETALGRSHKDDVSTLRAYLIYILLQIVGEIIPGSTSWSLLFLVVVSELTNPLPLYIVFPFFNRVLDKISISNHLVHRKIP